LCRPKCKKFILYSTFWKWKKKIHRFIRRIIADVKLCTYIYIYKLCLSQNMQILNFTNLLIKFIIFIKGHRKLTKVRDLSFSIHNYFILKMSKAFLQVLLSIYEIMMDFKVVLPKKIDSLPCYNNVSPKFFFLQWTFMQIFTDLEIFEIFRKW
jgi:hypothetical protein